MPEYLAPAVYVEETSFRSKSIEGVGTSTAAFVGLTARGPTGITPPLLTSFSDFERYYGGLGDLRIADQANPSYPNYLAHAAFAFFNNGGGRLYVARVAGLDAGEAKSAPDGGNAADKQVAFAARFAGGGAAYRTADDKPVAYGVTITQMALKSTKRLARGQQPGTLVRLKQKYYVIGEGPDPIVTDAADLTEWNGATDAEPATILTLDVEVVGPEGVIAEYGGLGFHPQHSRYVRTMLGQNPPLAAAALANPVAIVVGEGVTALELRAALLNGVTIDDATEIGSRRVDLVGGTDGKAPKSEDWQDALDRLLALEDISMVAAPGAAALDAVTAADVNQKLISHAEKRRSYRIAVLDTPPDLEPDGVRALKSLLDSKYAAIYYPWIRIANPLAGTAATQPQLVDVPPSGAVCGIYARNDVQRGVFKAPANEVVTGALGLQRDVRFGEQEVLNPLGVNCIRALPNRGIRVWGARTLSSDPEWKYVNIRRYFLYLEASIDRGTQWAVFEPNGETLWANVRATVGDFLYNEWLGGALLGTKPQEAFFVRCDRSTMTQNDLDNGRLVCLVGVAAIKPAEFVIFRIGQKTADGRD